MIAAGPINRHPIHVAFLPRRPVAAIASHPYDPPGCLSLRPHSRLRAQPQLKTGRQGRSGRRQMLKKLTLAAAGLAALAWAFPTAAYPTRPVTLLIAFPPGG